MSKRAQRGAVLLAMLVVLVLGAAWWTVTAISKPANRAADDRAHNARVLAQAKAALIGWIAMTAANAGENNPGRLPCPETPAQIGTAEEGNTAATATVPSCNAAPGPVVGRLPWRALGIEQLRDAANEPLWYVVTTGTWALQNVGAATTINSNSVGQLTVDGALNAAVALIIAPGPPLSVQASPGCAARNQARTMPGPAIDLRDYLECENATSPADVSFVTAGPAGSFNDQVLVVTVSDVLPVIEAAVADRFRRAVAPTMRSAYSDPLGVSWPATPALPFAVPFMDPTASNFKGAAGTFQGLLPLTYSETAPGSEVPCTPGADARCDPMFVAWQNAPAPSVTAAVLPPILVPNPTPCAVTVVVTNPVPLTQTTRIDCVIYGYWLSNTPLNFTLQGTASNVGMALRQFDTTVAMAGVAAAGRTVGGVLNANGSASVTLSGNVPAGVPVADGLCGLAGFMAGLFDCYRYNISVPIFLLADQALVDPQGWFVRNGWHQVSYYAVAPDIAPSGPRACGANCLTVNFGNPAAAQRGLVAISGRSLLGNARPNGNLADWLESENANADLVFAVRDPALLMNRTFNDRIAVVDP